MSNWETIIGRIFGKLGKIYKMGNQLVGISQFRIDAKGYQQRNVLGGHLDAQRYNNISPILHS